EEEKWTGDGWYEATSSSYQGAAFVRKGTRLNYDPPSEPSARIQFDGWRKGGGANSGFVYESDGGDGDYEPGRPATLTLGNPGWKLGATEYIRNTQDDGSVRFTNMGFSGGLHTILGGSHASGGPPEAGSPWTFQPVGDGDPVTLDWDGYKLWKIRKPAFFGNGMLMP
ncbi:MAG: hypothetical protein FWF84_07295, partial [Kiritimatiellaeota bacterium]|nr:hypothetical protein [Kiritimatiellota bacterium]